MKHLLLAVGAAAALAPATPTLAETELLLGRFFGACEDAGTDPATEVGEACIIESIMRSFTAEDNGITVATLPTEWNNYYDQIKAAYAGGNPPDVHVMHRHRVMEFASLGAIAPLTEAELASVGIDVSDWAPAALEAVSFDGQIYAVPMDFHALLWHVNVDLMAAAGLVDDNGVPILPTSPEELIAQAEAVRQATGKDYMAQQFQGGVFGMRTAMAFVMQQGANLYEGDEVTVETDAMVESARMIQSLIDGGHVDVRLDYPGAQQQFLDGEVAVLVNGTWVVDFYDAQAADETVPLQNYHVTNFPTLYGQPAVWADTHMWAIPASLRAEDPEKFQAALQLLAHINDNNAAWAKTGHMAVRTSVLESDAYNNLPHREDYAETAANSRDIPPTVRYGAIQDTLARELLAFWMGDKSLEDALSDAQLDIEDLM
jgi:multiple sugar transport system substrate-binding protein